MAARTGMLVAYRTVQYPQMADCAGGPKALDHQIGYRYQVTYLNAAGREVCCCPELQPSLPAIFPSRQRPQTCVASMHVWELHVQAAWV